MDNIITLNKSNIDQEHICCAISDKKCKDSYEFKKDQAAPTPAIIFSLFYNGKFVTTDLSACMDSRFDKVVKL